MSPKLKCHQKKSSQLKCHKNWKVTKTEMSQKLKCHENWCGTKTEILLKLKFYPNWNVTKDVTVKHEGFLTLESPLIRQIHSSCHRRRRAPSHLHKPCDRPRRDGLTVRRIFDMTEQDKDRTGQCRTVQDDDRRGCFPRLWYFGWSHQSFSNAYLSN